MQSANDMDTILDACAKHNVQFMDGTMWLHNPRTAYIAEILRNEALMGPLRTVAISTFQVGHATYCKLLSVSFISVL